MLRALSVIVVVLSTAACGSDLTSSTAPSPTKIVVGAPTPTNATYTLSGRVTETAPTASDGIPGATLTIDEGVNAGRSVVTNARGYYTLADLHPSEFALRVTAPGFVASSETVALAYDRTSDVQLRLEPAQLTYSLRGDIASVDGQYGQCSDGEAMRACRIILFPVHNPGPIQATLHWTTDEEVDLDLTLFQTDVQAPIARAGNVGNQIEQLRGKVTGGTTYELRVTLRAGNGEAFYTLDFSQPN
jgi:hypothetical protein